MNTVPGWLLVLTLGTAPALASPRLSCEVSQGGTTLRVRVDPVADPYTVKAIDINERFRFKAVVIGDAQRIDYVKLYAYYVSSGRPVLLHYASYISPASLKNAAPGALTGQQYVYSPVLGREMQYACALLEGDI